MDLVKQPFTHVTRLLSEQREHSRFSLEVPLRIHFRSGELILGRTVDVSESGISAVIPLEMIVGQAVELDFQLPSGPICVRAMVKNKSAFRYGLEFVLGHEQRGILKNECTTLAFRSSQRKP
jgi:hypothetical protein